MIRKLRDLFDRAATALVRRVTRRDPDFVVGAPGFPYLLRWWLIPRNRVLNIYLHKFCRDDDDRALHDHPWPWCSIVLIGGYYEHTIRAGGVHVRTWRQAGSVRISGPWRAHRIELPRIGEYQPPCWTLFITGPRVREWGFHCPSGWVHWRDFTDPSDYGRPGPGCEAANDNNPARVTRKGAA